MSTKAEYMGKLMNSLQKQLKTEHKQHAEDCIKIYNYLKERNNNHIWESQWNPLVSVTFIGNYPNYEKRYKPTNIGDLVLKGLKEKS